MESGIRLADPDSARAFLQDVSLNERRAGEVLFNSGKVISLACSEEGSYGGMVSDHGHAFEPELTYDRTDGWITACTCGSDFYCRHVAALMLTILAEHNAELVRALSAGAGRPKTGSAAPVAPSAGQTSSDLRKRLTDALGRKLNPQEDAFINKLQALYRQFRSSRRLTGWDLDRLGFIVSRETWGALPMGPDLPSSEYDFWLYIACYLASLHTPIPPFMAPITDVSALEQKVLSWKRRAEIDRWKGMIARAANYRLDDAAVLEGKHELRLVIGRTQAELQMKPSGDSVFRPLRSADLRRMEVSYYGESVVLTTEAEILWNLMRSVLQYGSSSLRYQEAQHQKILNRVLRSHTLEPLIVNPGGEVLPRCPELLRWDLATSAETNGDYTFRLVRQDGTPCPQVYCSLPGSPWLYLTVEGVFAGPAVNSHVLEAHKETRIPSEAFETPAGVAFLREHGVPLPAALASKIRTYEYEIDVRCHLRVGQFGSKEECVFSVGAKSGDGSRVLWDGWNWYDAKESAPIQSDEFIPVRDSSRLAKTASQLEQLNLKQSSRDRKLILRITKKFPEILGNWIRQLPPFIHVHLEGELASLAQEDVAGSVKLEVTETEIDWFDLKVVLDVADTNLTPQELRLLLNAKGSYVRLEGKGWRRLKFDFTDEDNERLARLGLSPQEMSDEPQRLHALQLADPAAKKLLPAAQVDKIERRASELKARVAPDLPSGVTAELRPYQLEGFHFLAYLAANRFGGILADDMGLGKTLQTLAWLLWLLEEGAKSVSPEPGDSTEAGAPPQPAVAVLPSLVVCPKSVMDNWQAEARRFTPGLQVKVWSAGELERFADHLNSANLHVINYAQLRNVQHVASQVHWLAVILDEGQYIKNPSSQTAHAARALKASHRLILSGTPIENRLMDLWSLMSFTMPGVLGHRAQFGRIYDSKTDPLARRRLSARVRPFLIRRTKAQVAKDLPDRVEEDLFCEMEGEQQTLYQAELKRARQMLLAIQTQQELAQQQFNFLTSLLRLRQICCHPRLVNEKCAGPSAKLEALLEQLEPLMEEGEKVLVFSQFVELLELLKKPLKERQWKTYFLAGQTENRGKLIDEFQSAEGPAVFLISLKAGGFGLNLTAASYVVLFDPWWNPAVENQAIDRTHRIGQTNKVIAYRLLIKNSIEEKIRLLQKKKRALAEDVLGEERFAQSLTLEDLRFLLAE